MQKFSNEDTQRINQAKQAWQDAVKAKNKLGKHEWYELVKSARNAYLSLLNELSAKYQSLKECK